MPQAAMTTERTAIPDFLRVVARSDGTLYGTLDNDAGWIELPARDGTVLLDGYWTPDQLRAIADYADHLKAHQ